MWTLMRCCCSKRNNKRNHGRVAAQHSWRLFCHHYEWIVAEEVVVPTVKCSVLPPECADALVEEHGSLDGFCLQDGLLPSPHEMSLYFAWTEQHCSHVADPSLLAMCVIDMDELGPVATHIPVDIDHLIDYNTLHHNALHDVAGACQEAFSEGGDCHHYKADLEEGIELMQWKTTEIATPLGKFGGIVHSLLEVQTVSDQKYVLEVFPFPSKERSNVFTSWRKIEPTDGYDQVHAEASSTALKEGLSVADVIEHLTSSGNAKDYSLVKNNCHHIVGDTFKWAVPGSDETPTPNPKWSLLAESLYSASPKAMDMLAVRLGAQSR